jgi:hypothetical protein
MHEPRGAVGDEAVEKARGIARCAGCSLLLLLRVPAFLPLSAAYNPTPPRSSACPPPGPALPTAGLFGVYAVADPHSDHEDLAWSIMRNITQMCYTVRHRGQGMGMRRVHVIVVDGL